MARPIFSGHESFACKSHWLKRGYDFVRGENNFNDDDAVVRLGVGKNMVASIKFWLKAIGLLKDAGLVALANHLFDDDNGKDPYLEALYFLFRSKVSGRSMGEPLCKEVPPYNKFSCD